jgi:hypothetical protein
MPWSDGKSGGRGFASAVDRPTLSFALVFRPVPAIAVCEIGEQLIHRIVGAVLCRKPREPKGAGAIAGIAPQPHDNVRIANKGVVSVVCHSACSFPRENARRSHYQIQFSD